MAYTQSGIARRQNIANLAQSLAGSKQRTAEMMAQTNTADKNRRQQMMQQLMGTGFDFIQQNRAHEQRLVEQKGASELRMGELGEASRLRGEEAKQQNILQYGEGSDRETFDTRLREAQKQVEIDLMQEEARLRKEQVTAERKPSREMERIYAAQYLHRTYGDDEDFMDFYFNLQNDGILPSAETEGAFDVRNTLGALYASYSQKESAAGRMPTEADFSKYVLWEVEANGPKPHGSGYYTAEQVLIIKRFLNGEIKMLFGTSVEKDIPAEGILQTETGRRQQAMKELRAETNVELRPWVDKLLQTRQSEKPQQEQLTREANEGLLGKIKKWFSPPPKIMQQGRGLYRGQR